MGYYTIQITEDSITAKTPTLPQGSSFTHYQPCPTVITSGGYTDIQFGAWSPYNRDASSISTFSTTSSISSYDTVDSTPSVDPEVVAHEEFVRKKTAENAAAEVTGPLRGKALQGHVGEWNQADNASHLPLDLMLMLVTSGKKDHAKELMNGVTARVRYLSKTERKSYKVKFVGDRLLTAKGRPLDTSGARTLLSGLDNETRLKHSSNKSVMGDIMNRFIFVMSPSGKLYVADFANEYKKGGFRDVREFNYRVSKEMVVGFHHSSFLAGNPVACAGEIEVRRGQLIGISNASGHYMPSAGHLYNCLKQIIKHTRGLLKIQKVEVTLLKPADRWGNDPLRFRGHDFMAAMKKTSKDKRFEPWRYVSIFKNTRMLRKGEHWFR